MSFCAFIPITAGEKSHVSTRYHLASTTDSIDTLAAILQNKSTMGAHERLLARILRGASDADISFSAMCSLLRKLGFEERIRGDHHIFTRNGVEEILNLQPRGSKAKPYQVKQVRNVLLHYKIMLETSDEQ